MKKNYRSTPVMIAMAALVVGLGATWLEASEPPQEDVFVNGVGGYPVYRIPSLVCTPKGTLLAFCEGRSAGDQSPTDIVLRRSGDGGKTWSEPFDIRDLPDPNCQASILRYTWADKQGKSRILFSRPAAQGRLAGTIRVSYDEGKTWPVAKVIHQDDFGYSCLAGLPDGTIGCAFETAGCSKIAFTSFSLAWLTDGKDALCLGAMSRHELVSDLAL